MAALDDDDAPLLTSLFGAEPAAADVLHYGPLRLRVIAKEGALTARLRAELAGRANSLLADAIFSAAFALAEYIEAGHTSGFTSVLELGAASGLPSLLLASRADGPSLAVLTDYPAEEIVGVTRANALSNADMMREGCRVEVRGHRWGDDVSQLPALSNEGFECVILSDLLWLTDSHDDLVHDIRRTLARTSTARALIAGGCYTRETQIESFRNRLRAAGLETESIDLDALLGPTWNGTTDIEGLPFDPSETVADAMLKRRRACWAMQARWSDLGTP